MPPPAGPQLDYAPPGLKIARNIPVWPALIINLPVLAVIIFAIAQPPGFWLRQRWFSEGRVWYSVLAVSVISVILAIVAVYLSRWHHSLRRKEWAASVVVVALFNVLLASSIYPPGIHKHYNYVRCHANLHGIALGIMMYTNEHAGKYPDRLETMILDEDRPDASVLTCPISGDTNVLMNGREEIAAALAQPGHLSYLYFGRNMDTRTTPPGTLIACDKPHNHDEPDYDCWALFADGSIQAIPRARLVKLIAQQAATTAPSAATKPAANREPVPIPPD